MTQVPIPQETGSLGTQETALVTALDAGNDSPINGLPITLTVQGLAASNSGNMGGVIGANLISGCMNQLAYDLQTTKKELLTTREDSQKTLKELSDAKVTAGVLKERVDSIIREQRGKDIFNLVGGLLIGISYDLFKSNLNFYAFILAGIGLLLLFFGFSSYKGIQK